MEIYRGSTTVVYDMKMNMNSITISAGTITSITLLKTNLNAIQA